MMVLYQVSTAMVGALKRMTIKCVGDGGEGRVPRLVVMLMWLREERMGMRSGVGKGR